LKDNPGIAFEDVVAELGFTMEQIRDNQTGGNRNAV
jgi:hypothetical protein